MMEPHLVENGKSLPLRNLSYEQCDRLHSTLLDRVQRAYACRASGIEQLQSMLSDVEARIAMFESGQLKRAEERKPTYRYLKIDD